METETLLTIQQTAEVLGVTENAVRIALREGRLPFVLALGRRAIQKKEVEKYILRTRPNGQRPKGRPKGSKNTSEGEVN